jgi:hypothetical protein
MKEEHIKAISKILAWICHHAKEYEYKEQFEEMDKLFEYIEDNFYERN